MNRGKVGSTPSTSKSDENLIDCERGYLKGDPESLDTHVCSMREYAWVRAS